MAFDRIFGQSRVKKIIASSMKRNRLAHAHLFYGPPGVGKDAMAIGIAMSLNCAEGVIGGCGECVPCHQIMGLEHPHFHLVLPVPTRPKTMKEEKYREILRERAIQRMTNPYQVVNYNPELSVLPIIGIDQIRRMKQEVMLKVGGGGYRVFLLSHAELLTPFAANSLLKLLEEPPPKTILFLTTSMQAQMMETIVSRCQTVRFDSLSVEEIENALVQRWDIPRNKATFFARVAGGSLQRGLALTEQDFEERRETALAFLEKSIAGDTIRRVECVEELINQGDKFEIQGMLRILQVWLWDILYLNWGHPQQVMNVDQMNQMKQFRNKWPQFDTEAGLQCVQQSIDFIEKNVYLSLIMTSLSIELRECLNR